MNRLIEKGEFNILTTRISVKSKRQVYVKANGYEPKWMDVSSLLKKPSNVAIVNEFKSKFDAGFSTTSIDSQDPFYGLSPITRNHGNMPDETTIPLAKLCNFVTHEEGSCVSYYCENWRAGVECPINCPLGDNCSNQLMQITNNESNLKIFRTKHGNFGIKSLIPFRANEYIGEYKGEIRSINDETISSVYCMDLTENSVIDSSYFCNSLRFVNHSCLPNACSNLWAVNGQWRLAINAVRNIAAGEEITIDYGENYSTQKETCFCQSPNCAGEFKILNFQCDDNDQKLKMLNMF
ncbi:hypothetical protein HUG17_0451 [Dermatophagoides farinae]|uniref:SET domain-containing protein n=1 Tax=Dermatophagoides farinae TaxID=6954 RepID=A0A9D4P6D0_DERFA|nr:hypothetical protein HUG17_0451 [Dermatophagoides farinae]